ncbi:LLM class flavin-dependent oxidoreductase [Bacillus haynesii]|uniref:LLM class flavin-dependent oxidoreductase n=1 Tax=Bacillus haynesii TaxID=1925021 RepID=UPI0022815B1B|nr:LLM class flavin-dependent oxidoreductase [Bacillus haynesii]MCY8559226.1 LLM class flavin-dependent oxidoreductase [Bacillus haynesii]
MMQLSILDQVPISKGSDAYSAVKQSAELAELADQWGYKRYWFAEHHSTRGLASTAPEIMIAHIAAKTANIRVGSGGVLLPQYSPFKVAENFRQLEALYPRRIDLGIGRSPGGTTKTRLALTDGIHKSLDEFPRQLQDLLGFLTDSVPSGHDYSGIKAAPLTDSPPEVWLLGLGENSAKLAGDMGAGYVFGHFISPARGRNAFQSYRESFRPSPFFKRPQSLAAVFVVCAESDEKAEELCLSQDLWLLRVEKGLDSLVPSIEEAKSAVYTAADKRKLVQNRSRMVIGSPQTVKRKLLELSERYQTDEFMILTNVYRFEDRKQSYERLAELF